MRASIAPVLIVSSVVLAACATPYGKFYQPAHGVTAEDIAARRAAPAPAQPVVERTDRAEPEAVAADYSRRGYLAIGQSAFNVSQPPSESAAIAQGKEVGADLVLLFNPVATGVTDSEVANIGPDTASMPQPHWDFRAMYFVKLR